MANRKSAADPDAPYKVNFMATQKLWDDYCAAVARDERTASQALRKHMQDTVAEAERTEGVPA